MGPFSLSQALNCSLTADRKLNLLINGTAVSLGQDSQPRHKRFINAKRKREGAMNVNMRNLSIRMEDTLRLRLRYIAEVDARSINGLILHVLREYARKYEALHGEINR